MIGKEMDVILAEPSLHQKNDVIGYLLKGGPKVLVKNSSKFIGKSMKVRIEQVISDKLIEAKLI